MDNQIVNSQGENNAGRRKLRLGFLCFASGIISIIPYYGVPFSAVAVILGILALRRIKRTGESGRAFAISGIVMAIVWRIAWLAITIPLSMLGASGNFLPFLP